MKRLIEKVIISLFFGILIGFTCSTGYFIESIFFCLLAVVVFCLPDPAKNEG